MNSKWLHIYKYNHIFFLAIFFITISNFAQEEKIFYEITCESGEKNAERYFSDGIYVLYSFGLTVSLSGSDYGFAQYYNDYLNEKYGFKYESKGCVKMPNDNCFNIRMKELLFEKYGDDMFVRAKNEAIHNFKKTEAYNKVQGDINNDKIFHQFLVHKKAEFKGGKDLMKKFVLENFGEGEEDDLDTYLSVSFTVEKDGSISDVELKTFWDRDIYKGANAHKIVQKLEAMPKWNPAIYFGNVVRVYESMTIPR